MVWWNVAGFGGAGLVLGFTALIVVSSHLRRRRRERPKD
jgi:hypothetical protein